MPRSELFCRVQDRLSEADALLMVSQAWQHNGQKGALKVSRSDFGRGFLGDSPMDQHRMIQVL